MFSQEETRDLRDGEEEQGEEVKGGGEEYQTMNRVDVTYKRKEHF